MAARSHLVPTPFVSGNKHIEEIDAVKRQELLRERLASIYGAAVSIGSLHSSFLCRRCVPPPRGVMDHVLYDFGWQVVATDDCKAVAWR